MVTHPEFVGQLDQRAHDLRECFSPRFPARRIGMVQPLIGDKVIHRVHEVDETFTAEGGRPLDFLSQQRRVALQHAQIDKWCVSGVEANVWKGQITAFVRIVEIGHRLVGHGLVSCSAASWAQ